MLKTFFLIALTSLLFSCNTQNKSKPKINKVDHSSTNLSSNKVSKPKNGFYCGLLDRNGILWFGSRGNGIYRYDGNTFTNLTKNDGLCSNDISCIIEDKDGLLWFGTDNGVCRYDRKKFSQLSIPQSDTSSLWLDKVYPIVNPNQVMSILQDKQGFFWFGTNGAGVYRYDGSTFTQFLSDVGMVYEDGLQHNIVLSIIEDLSGNIWFSSLSHAGVSRYDGSTFTHFTDELSDDFIRVVFCDKKGNIWIGTHGNHNGGLDLFDGEKFTSYHKTNNGFSHNNVISIYEDTTARLWVASGTTNLAIFEKEQFKLFTAPNGQNFDHIHFLLEDAAHHIWFGGRDGLWSFDEKKVFNRTR